MCKRLLLNRPINWHICAGYPLLLSRSPQSHSTALNRGREGRGEGCSRAVMKYHSLERIFPPSAETGERHVRYPDISPGERPALRNLSYLMVVGEADKHPGVPRGIMKASRRNGNLQEMRCVGGSSSPVKMLSMADPVRSHFSIPNG